MLNQADFLGIDLSSFPKKPSAYAGLDGQLRIACLGFLGSDAEIIGAVQGHRPQLGAIDAPLSLPQGLHCLEEDCPCQPASPETGRDCERKLQRLGIGCFFTTKRSIIKPMVYRAITLAEQLSRQGYKVLEVYPYASKVRLWGKVMPRKTTLRGLRFLRSHLVDLVPSLTPHIEMLNHDLCDAVVAAYTAFLHRQGKTEAIGYPKEGVIYIPRRSGRD